MAEFRFVTEWRIGASLSQVFDTISQCQDWPKWWKGVEKVELLNPGNMNGIGSLHRFTWKGRIPYRLTFNIRVIRVVPLTLLEGFASGEVVGIGCWHFSNDNGITVVRYEWHVHTKRPWMNIFAPIIWPLFRWNHNQVMRQGAEGMARLLNARLVSLAHN